LDFTQYFLKFNLFYNFSFHFAFQFSVGLLHSPFRRWEWSRDPRKPNEILHRSIQTGGGDEPLDRRVIHFGRPEFHQNAQARKSVWNSIGNLSKKNLLLFLTENCNLKFPNFRNILRCLTKSYVAYISIIYLRNFMCC
jgi:hypothetical protein